MGSKSKLLSEIWAVASQFDFDTVVDLFSGSGIVGYMFKTQGKTVISNDYTQDEMVAIMAKYKEHVEVIPIDYKYSFGNQNEAKTHRNSVQEYLFVGY